MRLSTKDMQMKKSLGRVFLLFLLFTAPLLANELATYELRANKSSAYVKEAVEITFTTRQKDHSHVMFFFLHPKKSSDYKIEFLTKEIDDHSYHNSSAVFRFVLFPLKSGPIQVDFDFVVKTASDGAVAKAYVEDHDDSVGIDLHATHIPLKPLHLEIKPLERNVDIVGDFTLQSKIDTTSIDQYGSVNLHYFFRGTGYAKLDKVLPNIDGVTTFFDTNNIHNRLTKSGYVIQKEFIYAFSAKKDFNIPKVQITAFSPTKGRYYTLQAPGYHIQVKKIDPSALVDTVDSPNEEPLIAFDTLKAGFVYLVIFILGYFTAMLRNSRFEFKNKKREFKDIQNSKSPKELVMLLIGKYPHIKELELYIDELEIMIQNKDTKGFEKVKKEVLKRLESL